LGTGGAFELVGTGREWNVKEKEKKKPGRKQMTFEITHNLERLEIRLSRGAKELGGSPV